jgi:DNA helicase-2/ATP-dependent DNA helicase PcrA
LPHKLLLASAGAGKSELIVKEALKTAAGGGKVLLLTYTINNQAELVKHICRLHKLQPKNVVVKGVVFVRARGHDPAISALHRAGAGF